MVRGLAHALFAGRWAAKSAPLPGTAVGNAAELHGRQGVLKDIVTTSLALIDRSALLIITPVVAFYLMRDWPPGGERVRSILSRAAIMRRGRKSSSRRIDNVAFRFRARAGDGVPLTASRIYSLGLTAVGLAIWRGDRRGGRSAVRSFPMSARFSPGSAASSLRLGNSIISAASVS